MALLDHRHNMYKCGNLTSIHCKYSGPTNCTVGWSGLGLFLCVFEIGHITADQAYFDEFNFKNGKFGRLRVAHSWQSFNFLLNRRDLKNE